MSLPFRPRLDHSLPPVPLRLWSALTFQAVPTPNMSTAAAWSAALHSNYDAAVTPQESVLDVLIYWRTTNSENSLSCCSVVRERPEFPSSWTNTTLLWSCKLRYTAISHNSKNTNKGTFSHVNVILTHTTHLIIIASQVLPPQGNIAPPSRTPLPHGKMYNVPFQTTNTIQE